MRLPFFRSKNPEEPRAKPPRGSAGASVGVGAVQAARIRARRRLIGALVLLAVGVVGFPILFETQPRPLPVDTPILVPEGTPARVASPAAARPAPAVPAVPADAGNEPVAVATAAPAAASAAAPAAVSAAPPQPVAATKPEPRPEPKPEPEPPKPEPAKASQAAKPTTPTTPTTPETAAPANGRFVVQVGAYNDPERLRAARQKVEKLGYKTYTQDVDSPTGKRTRVRVGPFASRQEADAVATKVKASGMQANILAL